jgi:hypothetical protein
MQKKRRPLRRQARTRTRALEKRVAKLEKNTLTERLKDVFTGAALLSALITRKPLGEYGEIIKERLRQ